MPFITLTEVTSRRGDTNQSVVYSVARRVNTDRIESYYPADCKEWKNENIIPKTYVDFGQDGYFVLESPEAIDRLIVLAQRGQYDPATTRQVDIRDVQMKTTYRTDVAIKPLIERPDSVDFGNWVKSVFHSHSDPRLGAYIVTEQDALVIGLIIQQECMRRR